MVLMVITFLAGKAMLFSAAWTLLETELAVRMPPKSLRSNLARMLLPAPRLSKPRKRLATMAVSMISLH